MENDMTDHVEAAAGCLCAVCPSRVCRGGAQTQAGARGLRSRICSSGRTPAMSTCCGTATRRCSSISATAACSTILGEIGVRRVEWVLFTHHHREQCQGAARLAAWKPQIAAPEIERALFEEPDAVPQGQAHARRRLHGTRGQLCPAARSSRSGWIARSRTWTCSPGRAGSCGASIRRATVPAACPTC